MDTIGVINDLAGEKGKSFFFLNKYLNTLQRKYFWKPREYRRLLELPFKV
jgi:hypothetical protein